MLNYVLRENIKKVYKLKFYVEGKKKSVWKLWFYLIKIL